MNFNFLLLDLDKFDLRKFLCSESELLTWKAEGLPSDQLSIENSIVILEVCFQFFKQFIKLSLIYFLIEFR